MILTFDHLQDWFSDPKRAITFWGNFLIHENGCQLWMGPFWERGHGRYVLDGHNVRVHRVRWVWARRGGIDPDLVVRHFFCENKSCGNPAHLILGTRDENADDERFIHSCVPMAFGPGHITGGEPGKK